MAEISQTPQRFDTIHVMRGAAALAVLLFHVRGYTWIVGDNHETIFEIFGNVLSYGALLFFGISGFLMAHLIQGGYQNFLVRRLARIYPTFWLAVALCVFAKVFFLGSWTQPDLWLSMSLMPVGVIPYPLNIEWTLVYEVFFYAVCSVFTIPALRKGFVPFLVIWAGIVIWATAAGYPRSVTPNWDTIFFERFNLFFIVGALVYHARRWWAFPPIASAAVIAAVLILIALWPVLVQPYADIVALDLTFLGCTAALLVSATTIHPSRKNPITLALMYLGDVSYGIYLIHATVLYIVLTMYFETFGALDNVSGTLALFSALICGIVLGEIDMRIHVWVSARLPRLAPRRSGITERGRVWRILPLHSCAKGRVDG